MRLMRWWTFRRLVIVALVSAVLASVVVAGARWWVAAGAAGHVYGVEQVPEAPVVMVLGARVYADGRPSPFLAERLELARRLYDSGRAGAILVSGDNGQQEYNEVDPMRLWLIERGVPPRKVVGDYAGFDTYDSCVRAREIFGVTAMTVVTQGFHIDRAVTLCRRAGIETNGVADESTRRYPQAWRWGAVREYGANVKAGLDAILGRDPVYLGRRESGIDDALR